MRRKRRLPATGSAMQTLRVAPPALTSSGRGSLTFDPDFRAYRFDASPVQYRVQVGEAAERTGLLLVEGSLGGGPWLPLVRFGMRYRTRAGDCLEPEALAGSLQVTEFRHVPRGLILTLRYTEQIEQQTLRRTLLLRLMGRALVAQATSAGSSGALVAAENYCGVAVRAPAGAEARAIAIPYAPVPLWMLAEGGFLALYLDPWQSAATTADATGSLYLPRTDGRIARIEETWVLAYHDDPLAVLPAPQPEAVAPDRVTPSAVPRRVVLDLFSEAPYAEDRRLLAMLRAAGLTDCAVLYRNWQQFGYDRRPPCLYPANPERGRTEEFRALVREATEGGWLFALREDYTSITPDSPYWDPKVVARDSAGEPRTGIAGGYAIAADKMIEFARLESTKIQRNYQPNAAFPERHTAWRPDAPLHQIDLGADNDRALSLRDVYGAVESLVRFLGSVHEGPVLGDGGHGSGRLDTLAPHLAEGGPRPLDGGVTAPVLPDYELRSIRPVRVGAGLGPIEAFFGEAPPDRDRYRATQIAFGHAGWCPLRIPSEGGLPPGALESLVTEYFLMRALQEQYLTAPVRAIHYRCGDALIPLTEALRRDLDFSASQVQIEFGNGLTVWVNCHPRQEWSVRADGTEYLLPPSGWLASNPRAKFLAYSALVSGNRADVCLAAEYQFLHPRSTVARRIAGITADGAAAVIRTSVMGRRDLLLVSGRTLLAEPDTLRLSERGDVRLIHRSAREIDLVVFDTESGKPIQIAFTPYSAAWREGKIEVLQRQDGAWVRSSAPMQQTKHGPQLGRALPGMEYRLVATGA